MNTKKSIALSMAKKAQKTGSSAREIARKLEGVFPLQTVAEVLLEINLPTERVVYALLNEEGCNAEPSEAARTLRSLGKRAEEILRAFYDRDGGDLPEYEVNGLVSIVSNDRLRVVRDRHNPEVCEVVGC